MQRAGSALFGRESGSPPRSRAGAIDSSLEKIRHKWVDKEITDVYHPQRRTQLEHDASATEGEAETGEEPWGGVVPETAEDRRMLARSTGQR